MVDSDTYSAAAICWFVLPRATHRMTSRSRAESSPAASRSNSASVRAPTSDGSTTLPVTRPPGGLARYLGGEAEAYSVEPRVLCERKQVSLVEVDHRRETTGSRLDTIHFGRNLPEQRLDAGKVAEPVRRLTLLHAEAVDRFEDRESAARAQHPKELRDARSFSAT
jgi:hypothetical protein